MWKTSRCEIIKLEDGSSFCLEAFRLWGPGKTAKVQCDMSAMFSADQSEKVFEQYC
jgi:hypothetical protein